MKIIPAIDIINGKCVRLEKGEFSSKKEYAGKPVDMAMLFQDSGLEYLHLVDLDGAKSGAPQNYSTLEEISSKCNLSIDFSGGLSSVEAVKKAFDFGASKVTIGSMAFKSPEVFNQLLELFGSDKIILAADAKDQLLAISGWLENTDIDIIKYIRDMNAKGVEEVMCTSISHDGVFKGPDLKLYQEILQNTKAELIASGGVSSLNDLRTLKKIGCSGAIVGKAIYEKRIGLNEFSEL